ncbi:myo-inositol transporter [Aspergillus nomiae NRRL 13137]|uniref:Myo-inositol transporter n=1 Tax=Aspergillus nomiae NRRL (strain ATCC 15546 / NRRL 13137 / CBS 260.88 / M93) TaxID=1509407 RepID=A0A0L1IQD8_ASPN3|nr:myo-inositol transporter [Aspergillus nomiae NRRL 13137]KNG81702.1 myo-inositol transporter [Aspergillus nomiae NRRL 13137]
MMDSDSLKISDNKAEIFHDEDLASMGLDDSIEKTDPGKAVWLIVCAVSMGGFLFGYDTGVISAVLVNLGSDLGKPLSSSEQELVTSITSGGALIGSVAAGMTADKYGRKLAIYVGCIIFFIGSIIQAAAYSLPQMTVGRLVVGFGVGEAAMIVPLYIGEMAPSRFRGRLIVFDNICVTFGQLVSYALGAALTNVASGWRYMVGLGAVPALLLIALMPFCPETPRQLVLHGRMEEARRVIAKIFPRATDQQVDAKARLIRHSIEEATASISNKSLVWQMRQLFTVGQNRAVSQLGGFNTLMYYSATLFSMVGFDQPTVVSIVVGATNFIFGFPNFFFIDRFGRRRMLLCLSLVVASVAFHWIPVNHDLTAVETREMGWPNILLLVSLIVYIAFYAAGVAPISWVGTEFLPLEVRALGTMMNSVTCWGCNIIISSTFLSMMKGMTPSGAFGFYAGICFLGFVFAVFCYAEVHNMPLESVREIYNHGFGVKYARQVQKELHEARDSEGSTA